MSTAPRYLIILMSKGAYKTSPVKTGGAKSLATPYPRAINFLINPNTPAPGVLSPFLIRVIRIKFAMVVKPFPREIREMRTWVTAKKNHQPLCSCYKIRYLEYCFFKYSIL